MECLRKLTALLLLAAGPAFAGVQAEPRIEDLLPARTELILLVGDMPALLEQWSGNPLAELWNDERMRSALDATRRRVQVDYWGGLLKMGLGYSPEEFLAGLPGQVALAFPELESALGEHPSFGLVAHVGDVRQVSELMSFLLEFRAARAPEGVEYQDLDEEFFGEVLHLQQVVRDREVSEGLGWAVVDGVAVVAQPKAYLQELVASVKQGRADKPWSETDAYKRIRYWTPESDLLVYMKGEKLPYLVRSYLGLDGTETQPEDEEENSQLVALETFSTQLSETLLADNIEGLYVAGSLKDDVTVVELNVLYGQDMGLIRLLAYEPGPIPLPAFVPEDAENVTISLLNLPALWTALRESAGRIDGLEGLNGELQTLLQAMSQEAGFDVEKALLSSLGSQIIALDLPRLQDRPDTGSAFEQSDTVYALNVTDRQSVEMALDAFLAQTGWSALLERQDYLETSLYTMKPTSLADGGAQPGPLPAYAVTDEYILYARSAQPLRRVLSRLVRPGVTPALWQRADVKEALNRLPEGASEISVYEPSWFLHEMFDKLAGVQRRWQEPGQCRPRPRLERQFFEDRLLSVLDATYKGAGSLRFRYQLRHRETP